MNSSPTTQQIQAHQILAARPSTGLSSTRRHAKALLCQPNNSPIIPFPHAWPQLHEASCAYPPYSKETPRIQQLFLFSPTQDLAKAQREWLSILLLSHLRDCTTSTSCLLPVTLPPEITPMHNFPTCTH